MKAYAGTMLLIMLLGACGPTLLPPKVDAQRRKRGRPASRQPIAAPSYRFGSGQSATGIPFDLLSNLIFLQVRVNNSTPLWFVLDTGASASVINAAAAKNLGLHSRGSVRGSASGEDVNAELIGGVSLQLPGVEVSNLTVGSLSLDAFAPVMGRPVGGILGRDLLNQFVVEIDYAARTINLYPPAAYRYNGAGERLRLTFPDHKPLVDARITAQGRAPVKGRFQVATASSGALLLNGPFVRAHRLLQTVSRTSLGNAGGVGGLRRTLVGRVRNIRLGRFHISNPIVSFSQAAKGEQTSAAYDGILGGEVLRRFKLILDYSREQIILEPNRHLPEPVEEDMSGLELVAEGEEFAPYVINEIIPGSPAAEAGLREDELAEVDGRPATGLGLEQIREMFKQEGAEHTLTIRRGEQRLQVKLRLRRLR